MAKSKYNARTFPKRAEEYARQGLGDKAIAKKLGVSETTFYDYQKKHPKFLEALTRGKAPVDEKVESAYYDLAVGRYIPEVKTTFDKDGEIKEKIVTNKWVQSEAAAKHWLNNRLPDKWSNSQHITSENNTNVQLTQADNLAKEMTFEQRQKLIKEMLESEEK
ncbi:hypothetical protein AAEX28_04120 [Lentisphaerota bacterium WC36G]|nr:hypothetical protein LJT99_06990 [Lentisphaerae bacterium WC36]